MRCKICGKSKSTIIGRPRFNPEFPHITYHNYKIIQCDNCNFYYIHPDIHLTQEEWSALYKKNYFANTAISDWQKKLHHKERRSRIKLIKKYSYLKIDKFLDMGCGEGYVLKEALKEGFEPFGLDIADNLDNSVNKNQINFFQGNIFDANYPDGFFSAIYMDSVLEHIPNPMPFLKELNRILKSNGIILTIVPNEDSLINEIKKILYTISFKKEMYGRIKPFVSPYHIHGYNIKSLNFAIKRSGFRLIKLFQFGGKYTYWKSYKFFSKSFMREVLIYPFGLLSIPLKKQIQLKAIYTK